MIYAYADGNSKTIVAAATSIAEFDSFYAQAVAERQDYTAESQPEFMDMLTNPVFAKLKKPPFVFEHLSPSQAEAFRDRYKITVLGPNAVIAKAEDMMDAHEYVTKSALGEEDTRTIGEVLGLDKDDPWDKRTDEEKEQAEAFKKQYDQAKKQGLLSGESFGGGKGSVNAKVTDINSIRNADGQIVITDVRAVKGLHDAEIHPAYAMEEEVRIRRDYAVNPQDYYKADAANEPQSKRPRDYNFAAYKDADGATLLALTPRRTFKFSRRMEDKSLAPIFGGSFPFAADEVENGLFAVPVSVDEARKVAEGLGFVPSEDFQNVFTPPTVEELLAKEQARQDEDRKANPDNYVEVDSGEFMSSNPDDYAFGVAVYPDQPDYITVHVAPRQRYEITKDFQEHIDLSEALDGKLPEHLGEAMEQVYHFDRGLLVDRARRLQEAALREAFEAAAKAGVEIKQPEPVEKTDDEKLTEVLKAAVALMEEKGFIHHAGIQGDLNKMMKAAKEEDGSTLDEQPEAPTTLADMAALQPRKSGKAKSSPDGVIGEEHLLQDKQDLGPAENFDDNGDNLAVANDGLVSIYFKVEITSGQKLAEVIPVLEAAGFPVRGAFVQRDHTAGCWFAFTREASASEMAEILSDTAGYEVEPYAIDQSGDRILLTKEAGIEVVDTGAVAETPIRPWNSRRVNWDQLTDEEKAENRKEWKGEEFILKCSYDRLKGCDVLITPKSYFYEHDMQALYPEELDLSHILPEDLKPQGGGWYNTKSRDENHLMVDLCVKRKFIDDWMLALYMNQNGL